MGLKQTPVHPSRGRGQGPTQRAPRELGEMRAPTMGPQTSTCLPAAPGLWRAAGGGGDRVPGVEGLASPSAPPQPRGERLHRRRLQGAAPASRQPPAQVPNPDPRPLALGHGDSVGRGITQGDLRARPRSAGLSRWHFPDEQWARGLWQRRDLLRPGALPPPPRIHTVLLISIL